MVEGDKWKLMVRLMLELLSECVDDIVKNLEKSSKCSDNQYWFLKILVPYERKKVAEFHWFLSIAKIPREFRHAILRTIKLGTFRWDNFKLIQSYDFGYDGNTYFYLIIKRQFFFSVGIFFVIFYLYLKSKSKICILYKDPYDDSICGTDSKTYSNPWMWGILTMRKES